jgi:hypothetical protein
VPPGIYNVTFGKALWRGVEVKGKGLTVLDPAVLVIEDAARNGHDVVDSETGVEVTELSAFMSRGAVVPGLYDVRFEGTVWRHIRLDGGKETVLHPGVVVLEDASPGGHRILDAQGRKVAQPSSFGNTASLVPGSYFVEIAGELRPFTLTAGQRLVLQVPKPTT